jgi:hypothetical protein
MIKKIIYKRNGMSRTSGNTWLTDEYSVIEENEKGYKAVLDYTNDPLSELKKGKVYEITKHKIAWNYEMRVIEIED